MCFIQTIKNKETECTNLCNKIFYMYSHLYTYVDLQAVPREGETRYFENRDSEERNRENREGIQSGIA